jgi:hypothetical protein
MRRIIILLVISLILLNSLTCKLFTTSEPAEMATATAEAGLQPAQSLLPEATEVIAATTEAEPQPTRTPAPVLQTPGGAEGDTLAPTVVSTPEVEPYTPIPTLDETEGIAPQSPPDAPASPTSLNVPLQIHNPLNLARTNEPVTSGLPLPRSLGITDPSRLRLVDASGNPVPAQFIPLARWGGSAGDASKPIRWALIDFQATVGPQSTAYYFLQEGGPSPAPPHPLTVTDGADVLTIDTGVARFSLSKSDGRLTAPGLAAPLFGRARAGTTDYTTSGPVTVRVAMEGQMRVSVYVQGTYRDASGSSLLAYTSRYWFYAGQPLVRLFHTIENNNLCPLVEYGQMACYEIGSGGSVTVADVSLVLPTGLNGNLSYQVGSQGVPASGSLTDKLLLYQDSSGTDHWDHYLTLTDWDGNLLDTRPRMQAYVTFRGYQTTLGDEIVDSGDQAEGWLNVAGNNGAWTVGVRDFWQNFPKSLRATPDGALEVGLLPGEFGPTDYGFNLRAGEHKTHEIWLRYDAAPSPTNERSGVGSLFAQAPAQWYVNSGAFGLTAWPNWTDWPDYENYVDYQLDTAPTYEEWMEWYPNLPTAIERTDFYGIFDYGDWPIDYEGYGVAPLNTKYDSNYGLWLQWARGGNPRWFDLAGAANRHLADVDILHNLHAPRHWGDGIAFGHSYHDEEGFINPHRNFGGNHPDVAFGVPGLLTTYYLTGYEKAYEAALELADCIEYRLHNDEHLCGYFADCSGEGYGLMDGLYDAGSRPAANSLTIAVAAYRATADPRYLAVADALVDWAKSSNQPYINGPTGQDQAMRPWLLNMYLRALADYLEMRGEFDLPDTYQARESYLAYANWLRTYAWLDLEPIDTGPRAAYPHEWWFDSRQGDPNDEWSTGNNVPSINNWLLLGADAMAYAYRLSSDPDYRERATTLFRTGSRDPWFEGDANTYSSTKETANGITFGHIFLYEWGER